MNVISKTGTDFEYECTGTNSVGHTRRRIKSATFFDAVEMAKRARVAPGWCPECPKKRITKALYDRVASILGKDKKHLKLYVAIRTIMDSMYGVDLFFQYREAIVTVDITISPSKYGAKADFVITKKDVLGDIGFYKKADAIAKALKGGWLENSQFMTESQKLLSKILVQYLRLFIRLGTTESQKELNILNIFFVLAREIHLSSQGK